MLHILSPQLSITNSSLSFFIEDSVSKRKFLCPFVCLCVRPQLSQITTIAKIYFHCHIDCCQILINLFGSCLISIDPEAPHGSWWIPLKMIDPRQSWQNQILFWILTNFILILILIHILIVFLISLQFINYPTSTVKDIGVDNVHYSECLGPVPVFMSLSH